MKAAAIMTTGGRSGRKADPTLRETRGGGAAPNAMIYTGNCK